MRRLLRHSLRTYSSSSTRRAQSSSAQTADFQWDNYAKVVKDTTTQKGYIYFERDKGSTDMGAVLVDPNAGPKSKPIKVIQYQGGTFQMFDPGVDQITIFHAAGNQSAIESFLTLGFGGSGTDLARVWNITDLGPETFNDNGQPVKVEKLDPRRQRRRCSQELHSHYHLGRPRTRCVSQTDLLHRQR